MSGKFRVGWVARMGPSLHSLPLEQRLKSYRATSDQALHKAAKTYDPETRAALLAAAAKWQALATEIEKVRILLNETGATHRP